MKKRIIGLGAGFSALFYSLSLLSQCTADFSFQYDYGCDPTITYTAAESHKDDYRYSWDFGDGNKGEGAECTHTYEAYGNEVASYKVIFVRGGSENRVQDIQT